MAVKKGSKLMCMHIWGRINLHVLFKWPSECENIMVMFIFYVGASLNKVTKF